MTCARRRRGSLWLALLGWAALVALSEAAPAQQAGPGPSGELSAEDQRELERLRQLQDSAYSEGDADALVAAARSVLALLERTGNERTVAYVGALTNLGIDLNFAGDLRGSTDAFSAALRLGIAVAPSQCDLLREVGRRWLQAMDRSDVPDRLESLRTLVSFYSESCPDAGRLSEVHGLLGFFQLTTRADAEFHYRESLNVVRGQGTTDEASAMANYATFLALLGRHDEAVALRRESVRIIEALPGGDRDWRYHLGLSTALAMANRYEEARQAADRTIAMMLDSPASGFRDAWLGSAYSERAYVEEELGGPRVEEFYRLSNRIFPSASTLANYFRWLADVGRHADALDVWRQISRLAEAGDEGERQTAAAALDSSHALAVDVMMVHAGTTCADLLAAATTAYELASERYSGADLSLFASPEGPLEAQRASRDAIAYLDASRHAERRGCAPTGSREASAFLAAQLALGVAPDRAIPLQLDSRGPNASAAALLRDYMNVVNRLQAVEARLLSAGPASPYSEAALRRFREQRGGLLQERERLAAGLGRSNPRFLAFLRSLPVTVEAMREILASDEAAVLIVPSQRGTHVVAISDQRLASAFTEWTEERVAQSVTRLRQSLSPPPQQSDAGLAYPDFDRREAYELYRNTLAPLMPHLAGMRTVYVASAGALASLPLGVLVTEQPQGDDGEPSDLRRTAWLSDRIPLVQLPTLQSLQALRESPPTGGGSGEPRAFAGFGDPAFEQPDQRRGTGGAASAADEAWLQALRTLPALPGTGEELRALAQAFGAPESAIRLGAAATETAAKAADLSDVRILAFATHGVTDGELDPSVEAGLVLTPPEVPTPGDDGLLTASEIAGFNLNAEWVILSACNTAGTRGAELNHGLNGLARGFFFAGARSLLVSHWPVRDDVAPRLVVESVRLSEQGAGRSRAQALQAAIRRLREDPVDPSRAHPAAWAPFSLMGEGS